MNKNKGAIGLGLVIAIVLGIAVVGVGAYYLGNSRDIGEEINSENIPSLRYISDDLATYTNSEYGFSFQYKYRLDQPKIFFKKEMANEYLIEIGGNNGAYDFRALTLNFPQPQNSEPYEVVNSEKGYQNIKGEYKVTSEFKDLDGNSYFATKGLGTKEDRIICGDMYVVCYDHYIGVKKLNENKYGLKYLYATGDSKYITLDEFKKMIASFKFN